MADNILGEAPHPPETGGLWHDVRDALGVTVVRIGVRIMSATGRAMLAREIASSSDER